MSQKPPTENSLPGFVLGAEDKRKLAWICRREFRTPEEEIAFLIDRRHRELKAPHGSSSIPLTGVDSLPQDPRPSRSARRRRLADEINHIRSREKNAATKNRGQKSQGNPGKPLPKNYERRIFQEIQKEMENMAYILVDLENYVPPEYRPLNKSQVNFPALLEQLEHAGYFVSLDLQKAQEEHHVVFSPHHDFFLGKRDFAF